MSDGLQAKVLQENHYYPFGMQMNGSWDGSQSNGNEQNRYRYNGKEFSEELGLYDYGARWYDPSIARWGQVDPLAEKFLHSTPYGYVENNPISFVDPNGMDHIFYLAIQQGADVDRDALIANTQKILDLNRINQQVQLIEISGEVDRDDYISNMDKTDALTFVGSEEFVEGIYGGEVPIGYSAHGIGYLNLDKANDVLDGSENVSGNLARIAVHEGIGHAFAGTSHSDETGFVNRYKKWYHPGTDQNVMTSGNNTKFSKDPFETGGAMFVPEDISIIKSKIPNQSPGIEIKLHPKPLIRQITRNLPKDNLTRRLKR